MSAIPKRLGLLVLALAGCGKFADSVFCASAGCDWKPGEWERIAVMMQQVAARAVAGELTVDQATAEMDREADRILAKRRWLLDRAEAKR